MRIENLGVQGGTARPVQQPRSATIQPAQQQATQGTGTQRSMTDALIMMQKAQSIVSQALSVSSRLQNIAAESMTTGRVNREEITREVSSIDAQLGQFGTGVIQPPQADGETDTTADRIRAEVAAIRQGVSSASDGEEFVAISARLNRISAELASAAGAVERNLIPGETAGRAPGVLATETAAAIRGNAASALTAQGNLATGTAYSLV